MMVCAGKLRELELHCLHRFVAIMSVLTVMMRGSPTLVALVTFVVHTQVLHKQLTASSGTSTHPADSTLSRRQKLT
jgi:hypothetical protein